MAKFFFRILFSTADALWCVYIHQKMLDTDKYISQLQCIVIFMVIFMDTLIA